MGRELVVQGLAERDHAVLRSPVDRGARRREPSRERRDVHDVAAALFEHHRQEQLRAERRRRRFTSSTRSRRSTAVVANGPPPGMRRCSRARRTCRTRRPRGRGAPRAARTPSRRTGQPSAEPPRDAMHDRRVTQDARAAGRRHRNGRPPWRTGAPRARRTRGARHDDHHREAHISAASVHVRAPRTMVAWTLSDRMPPACPRSRRSVGPKPTPRAELVPRAARGIGRGDR